MLRFLAALFLIAISLVPNGECQSTLPPRFEDYPVSKVYSGRVEVPHFGNPSQYQGTDLRCFSPNSFAGGQVNFAGHFVIETCSCGSGCHYLYMGDAVTGKFYQRLPPGAIDVGPYDYGKADSVEYKGEEHRADSSLLVVDGCVEGTCDCATRY